MGITYQTIPNLILDDHFRPMHIATTVPDHAARLTNMAIRSITSAHPTLPGRRRSTVFSTASSSTPDSSPDTITTRDPHDTPDTDADFDLDLDYKPVVPKIEHPDDSPPNRLHLATDYQSPDLKHDLTTSQSPPTPTPRKRGRPRKHPLMDQKPQSHARSKTGCGTCRRRKKKCDERKPSCLNCEKNNVVCDGYEPKHQWQSGREKQLAQHRKSVVVLHPPLGVLVPGIECPADQHILSHYEQRVGELLLLTDCPNPFLDILLPMAYHHEGLMHSLLYVSTTCLIKQDAHHTWEWAERYKHHGSRAMIMLREDIASSNAPISDAAAAQTLILFLQAVCEGSTDGSYAIHLDALKTILTTQHFANKDFHRFISEFLLYHDYSRSITSLKKTLDHRSISLMDDFRLPEYMVPPQAGTLLGVLDGIFGFISQIRQLRDEVRQNRGPDNNKVLDMSRERYLMNKAFAIQGALEAWKPQYEQDSPRYWPSRVYQQCAFIYLLRTVVPSRRGQQRITDAVDKGIEYLKMLPWGADKHSVQAILLMPLFLLGVSAFEPYQRQFISDTFNTLQNWSKLGNIQYAKIIVEEVWTMMDTGREQETWDWEKIIDDKDLDLLIT